LPSVADIAMEIVLLKNMLDKFQNCIKIKTILLGIKYSSKGDPANVDCKI
jgi:hypothetical protein